MTKQLPNIENNFSEWYNELVSAAELADHSPVRGALVIRPYGCAIWENIKERLDYRIKETGHHNAMFPLLIPQSFLTKEATHVEGFAPEVAVVTYAGGKKLDEPYVIRPTSETIIHAMFAQWIHSWRDLPLKINQWANVIRWEMRPRAFVRTTEFFWQEGHTAHATKEEAQQEVTAMLQEYVDLSNDYLAIPVVTGKKPAHERFPGAEETYTFEAMMGDGKALQMGTSHLLLQTFAHAFDMKFQDKEGNLSYPWLTSWAVTTRLVGALIMVHGDQKGLILPPMIAPYQIVIVPITKTTEAHQEQNEAIIKAVSLVAQELRAKNIRVICDSDTTQTPGSKFYHWELKGIPLRLEIGARDLEKKSAVLANRLTGEKKSIALDGLSSLVEQELALFQEALFDRAKKRLLEQWHHTEKLITEREKFDREGGFFQTGWCGKDECVAVIKEMKGTIRCCLEERTKQYCTICEQQSIGDVLVAKTY